MACRSCLISYITSKVASKEPSKIVCQFPCCSKPLLPSDFRVLLDRPRLDAYEASTLAEFVDSNKATLVTCPKCHSVVERVSSCSKPSDSPSSGVSRPHSSSTVNNNSGMPTNSPIPLTTETMEHYNDCRFKCRDCDTEFCSDCGISPYHLGFTCSSFKTYQVSAHCRFCDAQLNAQNTAPAMHFSPALRDVCNAKECLSRRDASCATTLKCGHACGGIIQDTKDDHLPCWRCPSSSPLPHPSGDDYCTICWSEGLSSAPAIKIACGHVFHYHCIVNTLRAKWAGVVITFGFLECPLCKQQIAHHSLQALLKPYLDLQADVHRKALDRFEHMNLKDAKEILDKGGAYYQNPLKYSLARFCYYPCFKCKKPYFGGLKECNAEQRIAGKDDKLEDLICGSCAAQGSGASSTCAKHGTDYIEYKCKFCCNTAAWYCWGSTHFCEECHKKAAEVAKLPKDKLPKCSCKRQHPSNGEEHCLGCSLCRFNENF